MDYERPVSFNRRGFIRLAAVGLVVGGGMPLLQACGGPPAPPAPTASSAVPAGAAKPTSVFPTFRPATTGPKPDFASSGPQYEDGFSNYPTDNPRSWTKSPPG